MTFVSATQFNIYLPWGQLLFSIVPFNSFLNVKASRRFQPGEGPSRGFLCDYEPSDGPSFQALLISDYLHLVTFGERLVRGGQTRDHC